MVRAWSFFAVATLVAAACSSGPSGGPVAGAVDTHCTLPDGGVKAQPISLSSCAPTGADAGTIDYGPTQYNSEADDDDCKYHVKWSSTGVQQNNDATFTVTATQKAAGTPATGANVDLEVFLNDTHPAPNSGQHTTENGNGTYTIGPVRFDAAGQWTIRFHLHEECADEAPDSPHGHAAFYLHVP
jgi:hypothetical protein